MSSASLITAVRNKYLEAIRSVQPPQRWKILVVDDHSQKLLGSVLKQFDILEENVTLIESITTNREPQPGFEAIYLLMPTTENIGRVIKDFDFRQQYAAAHLFFIEALPEQLLEKLFSSSAEPYLKGVKELFLNYWAIEAQAFTLRNPAMFFSMYAPPKTENEFRSARDRLEEDIQFLAHGIANLCISLDEFPYIRYYFPSHHQPLGPFKPHATTRSAPPPESAARWRTNLARGEVAREYESAESDYVSRHLAFAVQKVLEDYKRNNSDFPKKSDRGRATLIITDRAFDMFAPLLHEFTYQAMCNDLLPIENGNKYTYKFQAATGKYEDKTAVLSDEDTVWTEVRHMHMREAIDKLMADFNKFLEENAGFKGEGAASLNDMKDMLANLPQYQEMREKFSLHLNMAEQCMSIFEKDKLPTVANVEQCCATGLTAEGKTPKHLVEDMVPLLDSRDVMNLNKVRVIALYILHRDGVPEEDRRRLYQHARLSIAEQDAVNALVYLGVRITRGPNDRDIKRKIKQKPAQDEEYDLSRYKPLLRTMVEEHVSGKLDETLFPYVKDSPLAGASASPKVAAPPPTTSLRSAKANWHKGPPRAATVVSNKNRLILFMAGGMTYSEMREAYALSTSLNKDIIIGSTHTLTPKEFVDDLKVLELAGVGSRAIPNGLRDPRGKRPFQEFYDERYFLKDPPPPQRAPPPQPVVQQGSGRMPSVPRPGQISQSNSYTESTHSVGPGGKEEKEKKKKKGLFRF